MITLDNASDITPQQREAAIQYLNQTRDAVIETVTSLSPAQLAFKPSPDCWSAAETVEHLGLIANLVVGRILKTFDQGPPPTPDVDNQKIETRIRYVVPARTTKVKGPEAAMPTGRWSVAESLDHLTRTHASMIEFVKTRHDLRAHTAPHPLLGILDGYQWALLVAAHAARHVEQIQEVKADPGFPAA